MKKSNEPWCSTRLFTLEGQRQRAEVFEGRIVRRCDAHSKKRIDQVTIPVTNAGCAIEEITVSKSGAWLVTQRFSGQGEWGYDVIRTEPLARVAGVAEELGYMIDLPVFSPDESFLVGVAGEGCLGGWWAPDGDPEDPAEGGPVAMGFLFVHRLVNHKVTRHELRVNLPRGWIPKNPDGNWFGPRKLKVTESGVRFVPSWGVAVELEFPLPKVIRLPVPHPSGRGLQ